MQFALELDADRGASSVMKTQSVLVTGASGFLGREIVHQFGIAGVPVIALARQWSRSDSGRNGVIHLAGDVTDGHCMRDCTSHVSTIIHCAGLAHQFGKSSLQSDAFQHVNVNGTETVLRAAAMNHVRHVVLISSVSVYGSGLKPTDESCACLPTDPYGESKLQAERVAIQICERAGIRLSILRMATIFGEGDPGNIARLMRAIDLQRFVWVGRGSNFKSLIFRSDAARACFLVAQSPNLAPEDNHCSIYNISLPPVRMAQIVDVLSTALGRNVPRWYIPARAVRMFTQGMSVCMAHRGPLARVRKTINKWLADDIYPGHRFEHDYGFRPEVSVEEGLRREVAWFRHSKAA